MTYSDDYSCDDEEFEVKEIIDKKEIKGKTEYLIRWSDYPNSPDSWEPAEMLINCEQLLSKFNNSAKNDLSKRDILVKEESMNNDYKSPIKKLKTQDNSPYIFSISSSKNSCISLEKVQENAKIQPNHSYTNDNDIKENDPVLFEELSQAFSNLISTENKSSAKQKIDLINFADNKGDKSNKNEPLNDSISGNCLQSNRRRHAC